MGFLSRLGLISQVQPAEPETDWEADHKALSEHTVKLEAKFKKAITDLAIAQEEIAALRPDAEKWRDRAARELQRGQAKRDAAAKKGPGK